MLEKIVEIRGLGRFERFKASGDVTFRRLTAIYGDNGRGKTTLAALLRSLQRNDPLLVRERGTLSSSEVPIVLLRMDDNTTAKFVNGAWSAHYPGIEIFDAAFVADNVYAGLQIDHEHKKNLYRVIIGERGVKLNQHVTELNEKVKVLNTQLAQAKAAVQGHICGPMPIDQFLVLDAPDDIDARIDAKEQEITSLKRASEIAAKNLLSPLSLPVVPAGAIELLGKTLANLSSDAAEAVRRHLSEHLGEDAEPWVERGLRYLRPGDPCPFCGQTITANALIAAYDAYFGEAYSGLKAEITAHAAKVDASLGPNALFRLQKSLAGNAALLEFWSSFVEVGVGPLSADDVLGPLGALHGSLSDHLAAKASAPLDPVQVRDKLKAALTAFAELSLRLEQYNASVTAANAVIAAKKALTGGSSLTDAKSELDVLRCTKARHTPEADSLCRSYVELLRLKKAVEAEKNNAKKDLDEYGSDVFGRFEASINTHLERFGAEFRIANTSRSYAGGQASSTFDLVINSATVAVGDAKSVPGAPSFRCTLSGGDRSALALAFFLARLEHDPDISDKLVVFDDPASSMDSFRMTYTIESIVRLARKARKTMVLSHDPFFLRRLFEWYGDSATSRALHLHRVGTNTALSEWPINDATRTPYLQMYEALYEFIENGNGSQNLLSLAQKIRVLLEENLRLRCPHEFGEGSWLGDFIDAVRKAKPGDELADFAPQLGELEAINEYSKKFHHSDPPQPHDAELRTYAKRAFRVIRGA